MVAITAGDEALDRDCVPTGGPDVALGAAFTRQGEAIAAPPMALMDRLPTTAEMQQRLSFLVGARPAPSVEELRRRYDMLVGDDVLDDASDIEMNEDFVLMLPDAEDDCEYSFEDI